MRKHPITHLLLDTTSSDEDYNGDCDHCLVALSAEYVANLLKYMEHVRQLHRTDKSMYSLECWDASPAYFSSNDAMQELRDVDGALAVDAPRGEPILLAEPPKIAEGHFQRVECQTVGVSRDSIWWTAYVKHTDTRIDTFPVPRKTLLRIRRILAPSV